MSRAAYDAYLNSAEWRKLRKRALRRAEQRCQLCNGEDDLHVHHRTYERVGEERITDLTVLCGWCHARFHDVERKVPRAEQYSARWRRVADSALTEAERLEFWSSLRRADLQRLSYAQWDQRFAEAEQKLLRQPTPGYSADAREPNREGAE